MNRHLRARAAGIREDAGFQTTSGFLDPYGPAASAAAMATGPLHLPETDFRFLFGRLGPSLGLWRGAEVAVLRTQIPRMKPPILDLGCGDGLVTSLVLPVVDVGLDPDRDALVKAASLRLYRHLEPTAAQETQLPPGNVGTILSNSVLEHIPALDAVLASAARLLRPGGYLILTVPTEAFGPWLLWPTSSYAAWRNEHLAHRNLWSADRWRAQLAHAGLAVEDVRPYLRHCLVTTWDAFELLQQIHLGRRRAFGLLWRRLPASIIGDLARRAARLDLSAPAPGGGRLIVARKLEE